jgi:hypothetical protein
MSDDTKLSNDTMGVFILKSRGIFARGYWHWIGFVALIRYMGFFNVCFTLALSYLKREMLSPFFCQIYLGTMSNLTSIIGAKFRSKFSIIDMNSNLCMAEFRDLKNFCCKIR